VVDTPTVEPSVPAVGENAAARAPMGDRKNGTRLNALLTRSSLERFLGAPAKTNPAHRAEEVSP
jgi:hypothetical protein